MTPEEAVALRNLASLARAYADSLSDELDLLAEDDWRPSPHTSRASLEV